MTLSAEPRRDDSFDAPDRCFAPSWNHDASERSGDATDLVAEMIWHGGGTRTAYEQLLHVLFDGAPAAPAGGHGSTAGPGS